MKRVPLLCALALMAAPAYAGVVKPVATPAPAGHYTLDKAHASLVLRVDHMGFSNFTARFADFDVSADLDPKHPEHSHVDAMINPNSLASDNAPPGFLDMLHGAQWLDAGQFPKIEFHSSKIVMTSPSTARVTGAFTLHGITKPVTMNIRFNGGYAGFALDPHARVGFSADGALLRSMFGIAYGIPEKGSKMGVGDKVTFHIEAELRGPDWKNPAK